jgi:CBS domain-containing protein
MAALKDFMTTSVHTVSADATVSEAAEAMVRGRFGSVLVMASGTLMGIFTERDVLRAAAERVDLSASTVRDWMTPDPVTATGDMDSADAPETMISHGFRHLPVVERGTLQGIVSLRDVLSDRMRPGR